MLLSCSLSLSNSPVGEVNKRGEQLMIAKGGEGGGPFNGYAGQPGQFAKLMLELKIISDVGLLGYV